MQKETKKNVTKNNLQMIFYNKLKHLQYRQVIRNEWFIILNLHGMQRDRIFNVNTHNRNYIRSHSGFLSARMQLRQTTKLFLLEENTINFSHSHSHFFTVCKLHMFNEPKSIILQTYALFSNDDYTDTWMYICQTHKASAQSVTNQQRSLYLRTVFW